MRLPIWIKVILLSSGVMLLFGSLVMLIVPYPVECLFDSSDYCVMVDYLFTLVIGIPSMVVSYEILKRLERRGRK